MMAGILLAAGAFTGIMTGTGMLKAMAEAAVAHVPPEHGTAHSRDTGAALDAAQPAVRPRHLLFRRAAGGGRGHEKPRRGRRSR